MNANLGIDEDIKSWTTVSTVGAIAILIGEVGASNV
jgi:hypothetical protein